MNITIGQGNISKLSRTWYLVAAAGVALGLSALIGATELRQSTSPAPSEMQPGAQNRFTGVKQPAQTKIYVLGSEAEKLALQQEVFQIAAFEGIDDGVPNTLVIEPTDLQSEQLLSEAITEDKLHGGVGANLIDLRQASVASSVAATNLSAAPGAAIKDFVRHLSEAAESKVYVVASEAEKLALQQDISAAKATEGSSGVTPSIVVIDSPEEEYLFGWMTFEAMEAGHFKVVDLRN